MCARYLSYNRSKKNPESAQDTNVAIQSKTIINMRETLNFRNFWMKEYPKSEQNTHLKIKNAKNSRKINVTSK